MSSAPRAVRWTFIALGAWLLMAETRNLFFSEFYPEVTWDY